MRHSVSRPGYRRAGVLASRHRLDGALSSRGRSLLEAWFAPLSERNFRLFFIGLSASSFGADMAPVVFTFSVLNKGFGVEGVSVVLAAETIPMAVLLLFAGAVADRYPRKLTMQSQVPREVLSRISAYPRAGSRVCMPIGFAIAAPVVEAIGTRQTLALAAARAVLSSVAVLAAPSVRGLRLSVGRA